MEYLPETLEQEMLVYRENVKSYSFANILKLFMCLCQGLHFLQLHHIAHRDLEPSNIMRDVNGNYKIIDLGISIPNFDKTLTQKRTIAGTLMFMAPEILKAFVDGANEVEYNPHKSDCYSLGVVMLKVCLVDEDVNLIGVKLCFIIDYLHNIFTQLPAFHLF
jgi:eukaryotic-like serine/threonine-protein kinase